MLERSSSPVRSSSPPRPGIWTGQPLPRGPVHGPAYTVGKSVSKTWKWPERSSQEGGGGGWGRPSADLLSEWMEATCLQCSVDSNEASEAVWDVACGTGFVMDFDIKQQPSKGSGLVITATVHKVQQRQVTFALVVADDDGELIAEGRHLRAYPTHEEMSAKIMDKLKRNATLTPGLVGWHTEVVNHDHTGGARDTAWDVGAVGNAVSTSAVLTWMTLAAVSGTYMHDTLPPISLSTSCLLHHAIQYKLYAILSCLSRPMRWDAMRVLTTAVENALGGWGSRSKQTEVSHVRRRRRRRCCFCCCVNSVCAHPLY